MEIEAKFIVPDRTTFDRLLQIEALAGCVVSSARLKHLRDQYLDTASGGFLRGGYACRARVDGVGGRLITLKSLTPARGVLHEREELEVRLPARVGLDPAEWPPCDAAQLASQLSHGQPLTPLFELRQERYQRLATPVGLAAPAVELGIDRVSFAAAEDDLLGVEAELLPGGDRSALQAIADELQQRWGLRPEPISKFERGLARARPELLTMISAR